MLNEHRVTYLIGLISLGISMWSLFYIPSWIKLTIDVLQKGGEFSDPLFLKGIIWMMLLGLLALVLHPVVHLCFFGSSRIIEYDLKNSMLKHLMVMHHQFFVQNPSGELISRINNDVTGVRLMMGFGMLFIFKGTVTMIVVPWLMFQISPQITLYVIAPILLALVGLQMSMRIVKRYHSRHMEILRKISAFTLEAYKGLDVLRSYRGFGWAEKGFNAFSISLKEISMKIVRTETIFVPILGQLVNILKVLLVLLAANLLVTNEMSIGDFAAYLLYLSLLSSPLMGTSYMLFVIQRGLVALRSLKTIFDASPEPPLISPAEEPPLPYKLQQGLEVRSLSWCYPSNLEQFVLRDISFTVRPGDVIGIFGLVGQGKSTLANLLCGWLTPPLGTIFLDGVDVCKLSLSTLRSKILLITQDPQLFSDTIEANIAFGEDADSHMVEVEKKKSPFLLSGLSAEELEDSKSSQAQGSIAGEISPEKSTEIISVARKAGLAPDLAKFPQGIQTMVGEMGVTLSGGQKQRVSLARSMLRQCGLLVLDDVLSAVDHRTEKLLVDQIYKFQNAQSTLIISHRISALERATRVLILSEGKLQACDSHQELIKHKGIYRDAWLLQQERSLDSALTEADYSPDYGDPKEISQIPADSLSDNLIKKDEVL